jgi:hypothetical protein
MPAATNPSTTRRQIKALRQAKRVTESNIAVAQLALSTARGLDEVLASGTKHYTVDRLARAHVSVLLPLAEAPGPGEPDAWDELFRPFTTPTPSTYDDASGRL